MLEGSQKLSVRGKIGVETKMLKDDKINCTYQLRWKTKEREREREKRVFELKADASAFEKRGKRSSERKVGMVHGD